jgi:hypothetical protein
MRTLTILLLALTSSFVWAEEIYREVGDDGVPTFSDQAMPGAEPITVREPSTFTDETFQQNLRLRKSTQNAEPALVSYSLMITDPPDGAAIRNNAGELTLTVTISPSLQAGHKAELIMDGTKIRNVNASGTIDLSNLDRGTHAFSIRVVDAEGSVITNGPSTAISVLRYHKPPG